jgi:hypothetical protein
MKENKQKLMNITNEYWIAHTKSPSDETLDDFVGKEVKGNWLCENINSDFKIHNFPISAMIFFYMQNIFFSEVIKFFSYIFS